MKAAAIQAFLGKEPELSGSPEIMEETWEYIHAGVQTKERRARYVESRPHSTNAIPSKINRSGSLYMLVSCLMIGGGISAIV